MIVSSHLLHLVEEICTRVVIIDRGVKVADGTLAELSAQAAHGERGIEPRADLPEGDVTGEDARAVMDSPFLYLTLCSMRNRAARAPAPAASAALPDRLGRRASRTSTCSSCARGGGAEQRLSGLATMLRGGRVVVELGRRASLLFVTVAVAWMWPGSKRPALAFSRADVQFLFTAPISRRQSRPLQAPADRSSARCSAARS